MVIFEIKETTTSTNPERTFKNGSPDSFTATLKGKKVSDIMIRIQSERGHLGFQSLKPNWILVPSTGLLTNARNQHFYPDDENGWVETYTYTVKVTWKGREISWIDLLKIVPLLNEETGKPQIRWG